MTTPIIVEDYIAQHANWQPVLTALRRVLQDTVLQETIKWRAPCYTYESHNILLLGAQKSGCVISFPRGAEILDPDGHLERPGPNTQAARVWRFRTAEAVALHQSVLIDYIQQAIARSQQVRTNPIAQPTLIQPPELVAALDADPAFSQAFHGLTAGRQRGYCLYFAAGKQPSTRQNRIQKYKPRILKGYGIHDCHCGHSQKPPRCDGSHKNNPAAAT